MIGWIVAVATAADPWIPEVLEAQLTRNLDGLSLPDAPEVYHLRFLALTLGQVDVHASLGSVVWRNAQPHGALGVEVRVGSPEVDNTGFGGWQDGFGRTSMAVEASPSALATSVWRLTDGAYKEAVEQYARKLAQWTPPPNHPGDYSLTGAVVAQGDVPAPLVGDGGLVAVATEVSAALRAPDGPPLLRGDVYVGHESGGLWILDTEGTRVHVPVSETTVRAVAVGQAPDGGLVTDQRLWTVRDPASLPPAEVLVAEATAMRDDLLALADASALEEEYVGPVVFEGEAARALFRYILVPQLEGTPPEIPFDSFFGDLGDDQDPVRLGRRVLPDGWSAFDDPTARLNHPGGYTHDMEGTPARRVDLIRDGIVFDLAMGRVPRKGLSGSNGHARGRVGSRSRGRMAILTVDPDTHRSTKSLYKRGLRLARDYERDHVLIVRRLQEPSMLRLADGTWFDGEDSSRLPPPVSVVRRYADGREERLRGAAFASVQRWILRDIVAAGPQSGGSFMAPGGSSYASLDPTEGMASYLSAPDVLVGEVEIVPTGSDPRDMTVLPPP